MTRKPTARTTMRGKYTVKPVSPAAVPEKAAEPLKPAPDTWDRLRWLVLQVHTIEAGHRRAVLSALVETFGCRLQ